MPDFNINKDIDNSKLNGMLKRRAELDKTDKTAVAALSGELAEEMAMRATFLALVSFSKEPIKGEDGSLAPAKDAKINFVLVDSAQKGKYFPIFTDKAAIDRWNGVSDYYTAQLNFDQLSGLILTNDTCEGLVLNVGTDNLIIERNVIAGWNERKQIAQKGHADNVITNNTPVEIYPANPYPIQLSNSLCETAKTTDGVNRLWLRGITLNGEKGYLLVVDYSGDRQSIFSKLGESGKRFLGNLPLHLVPFSDDFGKNAVDKVIPIYSKE